MHSVTRFFHSGIQSHRDSASLVSLSIVKISELFFCESFSFIMVFRAELRVIRAQFNIDSTFEVFSVLCSNPIQQSAASDQFTSKLVCLQADITTYTRMYVLYFPSNAVERERC